MTFNDLTQIALLGTERQTLASPLGQDPLARLQQRLDLAQREPFLLSAAALSSLYERAGRLPAQDTAAVPPPCAAESLARVNHRAGMLLLRLLGGEHGALLGEWLTLARQAGCRVPPEALPALLGTGATRLDLREAIRPVLGERGTWLATLNPDWTWVSDAASGDDSAWETGERAARLAVLERWRRVDPGRARDLVARTWKEDPPEDRTAFLAALDPGLSMADEAFLETALLDRRKEVRHTAAGLLARLPDSALVKRMVDRAAALLRWTAGTDGSWARLARARPAVLEVTLPDQCDKAMQRDGLEVRPPQGLGEKAWWLIQMLEVVPLRTWTRAWNVAPTDIVAASQAGEWKDVLIEAWTRAATRQHDAEWADALFPVALEGRRFEALDRLLSALPPPQREARLCALFAADTPGTRELCGESVTRCRHAWSPGFSRAVLGWLRRVTAQPSSDWAVRGRLKDLAGCLAPETLPEAGHGWPTGSPGWEFWAKGMDEFLTAAQFRNEMHAAFSRPPH